MVRAAAPTGWTAWAINHHRTGYPPTGGGGKPPPYGVEPIGPRKMERACQRRDK